MLIFSDYRENDKKKIAKRDHLTWGRGREQSVPKGQKQGQGNGSKDWSTLRRPDLIPAITKSDPKH